MSADWEASPPRWSLSIGNVETGFLGAPREHYRVVDRNLLLSPAGEARPDWARQKQIDPKINDFRLTQYDMMFGKRHAAPDFFPETVEKLVAHTS